MVAGSGRGESTREPIMNTQQQMDDVMMTCILTLGFARGAKHGKEMTDEEADAERKFLAGTVMRLWNKHTADSPKGMPILRMDKQRFVIDVLETALRFAKE